MGRQRDVEREFQRIADDMIRRTSTSWPKRGSGHETQAAAWQGTVFFCAYGVTRAGKRFWPQRRCVGRWQCGYKEVFDAEFYSCRLGVAKPDAAYFLAILNDIQTRRSARCMLLGSLLRGPAW